MSFLLPQATSTDVAALGADIAVLPVGSFEQHGPYLPLITDTVVACLIAERVARDYDLILLPPLTISCSHEHAAFPGTVSIRAQTLMTIVDDITASLQASGVKSLVLVNGHGGNYALRNSVQQATVSGPTMALFPGGGDWDRARHDADCKTSQHEDMHAGELEASLLLHGAPHLIRQGFAESDHEADDRSDLLVLGMGAYTSSGVIGRPSLGTADKGALILDSLSASFARLLEVLTDAKDRSAQDQAW